MRYNQSSDTDWAALQRNGIGNILFLSNDAQPKLLNQSTMFLCQNIHCHDDSLHLQAHTPQLYNYFGKTFVFFI